MALKVHYPHFPWKAANIHNLTSSHTCRRNRSRVIIINQNHRRPLCSLQSFRIAISIHLRSSTNPPVHQLSVYKTQRHRERKRNPRAAIIHHAALRIAQTLGEQFLRVSACKNAAGQKERKIIAKTTTTHQAEEEETDTRTCRRCKAIRTQPARGKVLHNGI